MPDLPPARSGRARSLPALGVLTTVTMLVAIVLLTMTSVGVGLGRSEPGDRETATDSARPDGVPHDAEAAVVAHVVDGDTIRVIAGPSSEAGSLRVRLLNIDAPELARDGRAAECLADEASARLASLLEAGDLVWLARDVEDRDRFDRLLRGVWTADGVFLNELLAAEGLARSLLIPPNDRFHAVMVDAEQRAAAARRGLWGTACVGVSPAG